MANWQLEKKVSTGDIIMAITLLIAGVFAYATLTNNDTNQQKDIDEIKDTLEKRAQLAMGQFDKFSKLESRVEFNEQTLKDVVVNMNRGFEKLGEKLDKLYEGKNK